MKTAWVEQQLQALASQQFAFFVLALDSPWRTRATGLFLACFEFGDFVGDGVGSHAPDATS
jgi:hypothetical protein